MSISLQGIGIGGGIAIGHARVVTRADIEIVHYRLSPEEVPAEIERFEDAIRRTRKELEMLSIERGLPKELHEFINEMKQQYTMDLIQTQCKPRFVHEYALSSLRAMGYKMAVCSNSIRQTVVSMMEKASLSPYLDLLISNEDVKSGKPDPEMYLRKR